MQNKSKDSRIRVPAITDLTERTFRRRRRDVYCELNPSCKLFSPSLPIFIYRRNCIHIYVYLEIGRCRENVSFNYECSFVLSSVVVYVLLSFLLFSPKHGFFFSLFAHTRECTHVHVDEHKIISAVRSLSA